MHEDPMCKMETVTCYRMDAVSEGSDPSSYYLALYGLICFLLVMLVVMLLYVVCSKKYRLNWFEKNLLESAEATEMRRRYEMLPHGQCGQLFLLARNIVYSGETKLTFRRNIPPPSSGLKCEPSKEHTKQAVSKTLPSETSVQSTDYTRLYPRSCNSL
jgi:hypothetical protein